MILPAQVFINGLGAYLPDRLISNRALGHLTGLDPEWIHSRTGLEGRLVARRGDGTTSMALAAAREAQAQAGGRPDAVGLVIVASAHHDGSPPGSAAVDLARALGATRARVIDISTPLTGFLAGLECAREALAARPDESVLLVGVEGFSTATGLKDRRTCYLFSDGAGAFLLSTRPGPVGLVGPVVWGFVDGDEPARTRRDGVPPLDGTSPGGGASPHRPGEPGAEGFENERLRRVDPALVTAALDRLVPVDPGPGRLVLHSQQILAGAGPDRSGAWLVDRFHRMGHFLSASLPLSVYSQLRWGPDGRVGDRLILFASQMPRSWTAGVLELLAPLSWSDPVRPRPARAAGDVDGPAERTRPVLVRTQEELLETVNRETARAESQGESLVCLGVRLTLCEPLPEDLRPRARAEVLRILSAHTRGCDTLVELPDVARALRILSAHTRGCDALVELPDVARYALLLRGIGPADAHRLGERLRAVLTELDLAGEVEVDMTISVVPRSGLSLEEFSREVAASLAAGPA